MLTYPLQSGCVIKLQHPRVLWTHYIMIAYSLLLYLDLYHEIVVSPHVEMKLLK